MKLKIIKIYSKPKQHEYTQTKHKSQEELDREYEYNELIQKCEEYRLREQKRQLKIKFKEYKSSFQFTIMTSRFTNATFQENSNYLKKNAHIKCIYGSPNQLAESIMVDSKLFILELNIDTNRIMGIGFITNHPILNKFKIYSSGNYNRFAFVGSKRVDRTELLAEEEEIMKALDKLCFYGRSHLKNGKGLLQFPYYLLYYCSKQIDFVTFIQNIFIRKFTSI